MAFPRVAVYGQLIRRTGLARTEPGSRHERPGAAMNAAKLFPGRMTGAATVLSTAMLIALTALAPTTAAAPTPARRASGPPRCATSGLVIWLDTNGSGAAGSIYYWLHLTNLSGRACTLNGYPGVSAVNLAGRQVGASASRESSQRPALVRLAPGGGAKVLLRTVQASIFPSSSCREVTAAGLRVYPPGEAASKVVPFPFQMCSRTTDRVLTVRAVVGAP
jgi:hypothetical protein